MCSMRGLACCQLTTEENSDGRAQFVPDSSSILLQNSLRRVTCTGRNCSVSFEAFYGCFNFSVWLEQTNQK